VGDSQGGREELNSPLHDEGHPLEPPCRFREVRSLLCLHCRLAASPPRAQVWSFLCGLPQGRKAGCRPKPLDLVASVRRTFDVVIVIYFLIPTLMMRLRVGMLTTLLGPMMMFPAAAVGARCVHDITFTARQAPAAKGVYSG
jgi:hypothetical protein